MMQQLRALGHRLLLVMIKATKQPSEGFGIWTLTRGMAAESAAYMAKSKHHINTLFLLFCIPKGAEKKERGGVVHFPHCSFQFCRLCILLLPEMLSIIFAHIFCVWGEPASI